MSIAINTTKLHLLLVHDVELELIDCHLFTCCSSRQKPESSCGLNRLIYIKLSTDGRIASGASVSNEFEHRDRASLWLDNDCGLPTGYVVLYSGIVLLALVATELPHTSMTPQLDLENGLAYSGTPSVHGDLARMAPVASSRWQRQRTLLPLNIFKRHTILPAHKLRVRAIPRRRSRRWWSHLWVSKVGPSPPISLSYSPVPL